MILAHRKFERIDVEAVKASVSIVDIVGRRTHLKPRGRDLFGLCPLHEEHTPSFCVSENSGFHCFGCGEKGDVIRFVMLTEGLEFLEAVRWLSGGNWPAVDQVARKDAAIRASAERNMKIADAQSIWASGRPIGSTPAEAYLRSRCINISPWSVRFANTWVTKDYGTGKTGPNHPALICAVQDVSRAIVGVQRIFVRSDGSDKADMPRSKLSLGQLAGCAMRLGPAGAHILIVEGPEDGLTLAQELPEITVWVAFGTSNFPHIEFPEVVRTVTLGGDNNAPGRAAVKSAEIAYAAKGLEVQAMFPAPRFEDFNDELRGIVR